jgi:hypothetical protein
MTTSEQAATVPVATFDVPTTEPESTRLTGAELLESLTLGWDL